MIFWACWASSTDWLAEELAPAIEALALEVDGDGQIQLMGGQLVADLGDQELSEVGAEHRRSLVRSVGIRGRPDRPGRPATSPMIGFRPLSRRRGRIEV